MNTREKLYPTLADYVAIAINPVLVMGLVGSLVYFLLELLYRGNYPDRLQFSLTLFVFAAVLITRISLEAGREHATPYGIALAVVVGLAINRYVDHRSGPWANFGWLINWGLMAVTWLCAHQLTKDSTAIDEREEAAGEGLLQTLGLGDSPGKAQRPQRQRAPAAAKKSAGHKHPPGRWVIYFSLAALPIFGLGQLFIPVSNHASRRYAFLLCVVYVACGLGLLLTTSFLALRRYLRQRFLEMPALMAGSWLTTGAVLIMGLLLLVAALPRPRPEYAISALPQGSPGSKLGASPVSAGSEGTEDHRADQGSGIDHARQPSAATPHKAGGRDGTKSALEDRPAEPASGSEGAREQQTPPGQSGATGENDRAGGQASAEKKGPPADQGKPSVHAQPVQRQPGGQQGQSDQAEKHEQARDDKNSRGQPAGSAQSQPGSPPAPPSAPSALPAVDWGSRLAAIAKWLFYLAWIGAAAYWAWGQREKLSALWQAAVQAWQDFWRRLFGRRPGPSKPRGPASISESPVARPRAFAEFGDPFATGTAGNYSTSALVRYTFAAVEAWAREQGCPRQSDQTPHEFAAQLGAAYPHLQRDARALADCYCLAAYSPGALPEDARTHMTRVWRQLPLNRVAAEGVH